MARRKRQGWKTAAHEIEGQSASAISPGGRGVHGNAADEVEGHGGAVDGAWRSEQRRRGREPERGIGEFWCGAVH